jgi:anti-sigma B factor antagonist
MTPLTITARRTPHGHVLVVRGALDAMTAASLRHECEQLAHTAGEELVLDLSGLEFCDSSGIAAFIAARNQATSADATFALVAPPPHVRRMIETIGLGQFFTIRESPAG